jgi:hypothetical protein
MTRPYGGAGSASYRSQIGQHTRKHATGGWSHNLLPGLPYDRVKK